MWNPFRRKGEAGPQPEPVDIIVRPANSITARDHLQHRLRQVEGHIEAYAAKHDGAEDPHKKAVFATKLREFRAERDAIRRSLGVEN